MVKRSMYREEGSKFRRKMLILKTKDSAIEHSEEACARYSLHPKKLTRGNSEARGNTMSC